MVNQLIESMQQTWEGLVIISLKALFLVSLLIATQPLLAQETAQIQNLFRKSYIQADAGKTSLGAQSEKAVWVIEKIANSSDVRIKHVASGAYLHAENDAKFPTIGAIQPGWLSALWVIEPIAETGLSRIKNKWRNAYLHTENEALEMGTIQPGWWSAQWQIYRASSVSTDQPATLTPGWVTFSNQGGYIARYTLTYVVNGQAKTMETGNLTLGFNRRFDIPSNATNIKVKGEGQTGLAWKTTFEKSFNSPPNQCFKSFGTTLNQLWDNNCQ